MSTQTESRKALHELIELLREVDERWAGEEWGIGDGEIPDAHSALMQMLEGGLATTFINDPARPRMSRIVTPTRKFSGDNSDAIYYDAPISADYEYIVRGETKGAVYISITIEVGTRGGGMAERTAGVINDTQFDIDKNGRFEIRLGGEAADRNWIALDPDADRITTRHYFENAKTVGDDPAFDLDISIENTSPTPAPRTSDAGVAAGIRRVAEFVRSRTLNQLPMTKNPNQPDFVGLVPNQFPKPAPPGQMGLAAFDAHYSLAPFFLEPDQALLISGRWPECRFGNVNLWNRFQQTLDYANCGISLNRKQTKLEKDGSFRIVVAHQKPKAENWLDTEGRSFGLVFWRFFLVEGEVETPQAEIISFKDA